jgi:ABC-type cobalamin/Fe3+-siderophores transport system ATPase subunit
MTHVLFLKDGKAMTHGTITECFTAENLSECFSMSLHLQQRDNGRYSAWAQ